MHPSNIDSMSLTIEKSKFVKSAVIKLGISLNILRQVVNLEVQVIFIVFRPSISNSWTLFIVPVISVFSLIFILFGKSV